MMAYDADTGGLYISALVNILLSIKISHFWLFLFLKKKEPKKTFAKNRFALFRMSFFIRQYNMEKQGELIRIS